MSGSFKPIQSPEDKLKTMMLERYDLAANADADEATKKFCKEVKYFLLLLKADMPKGILDAMETRHNDLKVKVDKIKTNEKLANDVKEKQIIAAEYEVYSQDLVDGVDSMRNSKIMKRRITGIILSGKSLKDMNDKGEKIRKSDAVETTIDNEEDIDGMELKE